MRQAMRFIQVIFVVSLLGLAVGGCTAIRGATSGAPGNAWYVKASTFSGKIKDVHYCPPEGSDCYKAKFVDTKELALMSKNPANHSKE